MPKPACGIYELRAASGRRYIGSSRDVRRRVSKHMTMLKGIYHPNPLLQAAYEKHGGLDSRLLLICRESDLTLYEQILIDGLAPEMNLSPLADRVGQTDEVRAKIGAANRGRRMSAAVRAANSAAQKAVWSDPAYKARASSARKDAAQDPGRRAAILAQLAVARPNHPRGDEWRLRISAARKGKPFSEEHKAALRVAWERRRIRPTEGA